MNSQRHIQFLELYELFKAHDASESDRLRRWRNVEPESARFLSILVQTQRAQHVLELGTSNGFSTLWLADALEATHGQLTTLDIDERRTELAKQHLLQFDLADRVQCLTTNAGVFLAQVEPIYDLIFLDAERSNYVSYLPDLTRLLTARPGCLLVVDNVLSHANQVEEFISLIDTASLLMHSTVNVGAGLLLCVGLSHKNLQDFIN